MPITLERGPRRGDLFEVEITSLTSQGLGEGSFDALVGPQREEKHYAVFVRKAVPGDVVRVEVEQTRRQRITGRLAELIKPSVMRIEPRCRHFGVREIPGQGCGGCTLQSLSYRHQLFVKERFVKKLMQDAGIDTGLVYPVLGMDDPWYYRNKMEFSFGDTDDREFALGMHPSGFKYTVLALEECFLESEFVSTLLPEIRIWAGAQGMEHVRRDKGFLRTLTIREGKRTGERMFELVTSADPTALFAGEHLPAGQVARRFADFILEATTRLGKPADSIYWTQHRAVKGEPTRWIEELLHGAPVYHEALHLPDDRVLSFEIHPRAFFQPNPLGAELLYATVIDRALKGRAAGSGAGLTVLDLYCGTGTIGMCLAPYVEKVVGIELQPDAVDNARRNAANNAIENIEFFVGDVGKVLGSDEFRSAAGDVDIVVVDPPRAGLLPEAHEQLLAINAPTLVYVSCNPKALARDINALTEVGYKLESIQPVDMFPQTYHVENIALLKSAANKTVERRLLACSESGESENL